MAGAGATCATRAVRRDGYWLVCADGAPPTGPGPAALEGPATTDGAPATVGGPAGNETPAGVGGWEHSERALAERYLAGPEWERYRRLTGAARRDWLLGRVAVKDAVRDWLGDRGAGCLDPADVQVWNEPGGRPGVTVPGGERLAVSIAHRAGVAVATVADGGGAEGPDGTVGAKDTPGDGGGVGGSGGVVGAEDAWVGGGGVGGSGGAVGGQDTRADGGGGGEAAGQAGRGGGAGEAAGRAGKDRGGARAGIDVELVEPRSPTFVGLMMTDGERRLGEGRPADEWVTAAWAAKEAVAKAAGTGLQGRPKDWVVEAADGDWLLVAGNWVRTAREGDHVVAVVARRGQAPA